MKIGKAILMQCFYTRYQVPLYFVTESSYTKTLQKSQLLCPGSSEVFPPLAIIQVSENSLIFLKKEVQFSFHFLIKSKVKTKNPQTRKALRSLKNQDI